MVGKVLAARVAARSPKGLLKKRETCFDELSMNGYSSTIPIPAPFFLSSVSNDSARVFLQTPRNRWHSNVPNPMGVAATHNQKERAFKVIQKYTRLKDQRLIEELYTDSVKFLERVPRVEPKAIAPIVELWAKSRSPSRPSRTTRSSTGWRAKVLSTSYSNNASWH